MNNSLSLQNRQSVFNYYYLNTFLFHFAAYVEFSKKPFLVKLKSVRFKKHAYNFHDSKFVGLLCSFIPSERSEGQKLLKVLI